MDTVFLGGTYEENWNKQGGWTSVWTNITIGAISSGGGELFDLHSYNKKYTAGKNILDSSNNKYFFDNLGESDQTISKIKRELLNDYIAGKNNLTTADIKNYSDRITSNPMKVVSLYNPKDIKTSISKMADYLEKNTDAMYNRDAYRKYQFSIFNELKNTTGEMDAAITVGNVFDKIIFDRGGFVEIANVDGIRINTIKDINWKNAQTDLPSIEKMIKTMPQELKDSVNEINISDLYNTADPYWEVQYKMKNFLSNCTGGNGTINVFGQRGKLSNGTVFHEAGHCLDSKGGPYSISSSVDWNNAMMDDLNINNGQIGVSEYATQAKKANGTNAEDFADSIKLFLKDESAFQSKYPNRYQILKGILK